MNIDQAVRQCEDLKGKFDKATTGLEDIFKELDLTKPTGQDPDVTFASIEGPKTTKLAASAIIANYSQFFRDGSSPIDLKVATQLAKIGDKIKLCFPGGAVMSNQEFAFMKDYPEMTIENAPGHLFYTIAQRQLLMSGKLDFTYDLEDGFSPVLKRNLKRELGEELGETAADSVKVQEFLPEKRSTILSTMRLPNQESVEKIARWLQKQGVKEVDGKLNGVFTKVDELVARAEGNTEILQSISVDSEEASGVRAVTLGELADTALRTSLDVKSFKNYKQKYNNVDQTDGIRNPSTTWAAGLIVNWLADQIAAQDTYVWQPKQ